MSDDKDLYATYNGLNRPALIMGIPLMFLLAAGFIALLGGFGAMMLFGVKGLAVPVITGFFLFGVRVVCEKDPNALTVIKLNLKGALLRVKHGDKIIGFDSAGI